MPDKLFYLLSFVLAVVVCSGCSTENRPPGLPPLHPVTLTFLLEDQPLDNALVILYPENEAFANWTVGSYTDTSGKAIIVTHGQFRGAPAGKFKVCVSKNALPDPRKRENGKVVFDLGSETKMPASINHVDPKFGKRETTPLEIEIPATGSKATNLTLQVHKPQ